MVKVKIDVNGNPLPCEIYLDGYLKTNLEALNEFVKLDWDGIGFIIGYEGDGKSCLAQQIGLYLNSNFSLDNIVFNTRQFDEAVENAEQGSVIIWDEADELGGGWANKLLIALKSKLKRIRSKNLFIIFVTPTIFDLNKYFVVHRSRFLIHVYSKGKTRGFFRMFNREQKKNLYIKGKKDWNLSLVKPSFIGRFADFPKDFPINKEEYNEKKDLATEEIINESFKKHKTTECLFDIKKMVYVEKKNGKSLHRETLIECLDIGQTKFYEIIKDITQ